MNVAVKIDQGLPLPPAKRGKTSGRKYPFDLLRKGDSFFVPGAKQANLISSAKQAGIKVATRIVIESDVKGVRVWRTA